MVKREMYMKRIRPFIGTDLIKVIDRYPPFRKVGNAGTD